jgi:hypothetical protein
VIVDAGRDGAAGGEGGDEEAGDAEAAQREGGVDVRRLGGRQVLEEAAPLVEVDDEDGVLPAGPGRHRAVGAVEPRLAGADVAVRMVVRGEALLLAQERRVDEGDLGEAAGGAVGEEVVVGVGDAGVLRPQSPRKGRSLA